MLRQLLVIFAWMILVLTILASAVNHIKDSEESHEMTPDEETGARVAQWTKDMNVNPEEMGRYFQGDVMLTKNTKRSGVSDENLRWPNGVIPYIITGDFSTAQLNLILDAMVKFKKFTCIRFKPRTDETNYVNIVSNRTGCWSNVGMIGGEQIVNLQPPGCVTLNGTVIHEFMHCCGFWHEHTRYDRDDYVIIHGSNIEPKARKNFVKDDWCTADDFDIPYDYDSVMHYSRNAFAINRDKDTITPIDPNASIGQRDGFSNLDVLEINRMYDCP